MRLFSIIIITVIGAVFMAGPAFAKCYEVVEVDSYPRTAFQYCTDQPSGIELNPETMRAGPQVFLKWGAEADWSAWVETPEGKVPAGFIQGWGNDRATNRGLILNIEDPAEAAKVARAINSDTPFSIMLEAPGAEPFEAFSGTFDLKFPAEMVASATPAEPAVQAEPVVADAAAETPAAPAMTPFQEAIAQRYDGYLRPANWLSRDCVIAEAESHRATVQADRIAKMDAEIARLQGELAKLDNPRAAGKITSQIDYNQEERDKLASLESTNLKADQIFANMVDAGLCRDRALTYQNALADCQKYDRPNCECEANAVADIWMRGEHSLGSQDRVAMNTTARGQCRM